MSVAGDRSHEDGARPMHIGVLGGGQLGQMLAIAGAKLGHTFRFFDPSPESCAASAGELVVGNFRDDDALDRFADGLDVVTYEFENVPVSAVARLAGRVPVRPSAESLRVSQDRLLEKQLFSEHGVETAAFEPVASAAELADAISRLGTPGVLKARSGGYDGRGQFVVHDAGQAGDAWTAIGRPCVYERFVAFDRELSLVGVRSLDGDVAFYPVVENIHRGGILIQTTAPAPDVPEHIEREAREKVSAIMHSLGHVGVFTVEFFGVGGSLVANETACRVHNTGHWTIEGARTSQFENHVRAITGAALGDCRAVGPTMMLNLIGTAPAADEISRVPGATPHLYGKSPRPGRKLGHATLRLDDDEARRAAFEQLVALAQHAGEDETTA